MRVYTITGVTPETQAYAMAKYSRSSQSMRESIAELSAERTEQFLSTFYFAYGHRSIADLAHVALAAEDISIRAAITLVDEQLWDGQERSTRYQDFRKSGCVTPEAIAGAPEAVAYTAAADALFARYHTLTQSLLDALLDRYPVPPGGDAAAHRRTLRARAFDVSRYLLPLATRTSVGQISSARALERQISRLLADPLPEARAIGAAIRDACRQPGYDLTRERLAALDLDAPAREAVDAAYPPFAAAPTLVKYAEASTYAATLRRDLEQAAAAWLSCTPVDTSTPVELADDASVEEEIIATLLYGADRAGHSYRQVQAVVRDLSAGQRRELIDLSFAARGPHDEWPRAHQAGYALTFDLLLDVGAFRDLHRHRRCVQIIQPFVSDHEHDDPEWIVRTGLAEAGEAAVQAGLAASLGEGLRGGLLASRALEATHPEEAAYLLPLGTRVRALFKMDLAQAAYISELRTKPGGHFSYRRIAYLMWQALAERYPALAEHVRVTNPEEAVDLLDR